MVSTPTIEAICQRVLDLPALDGYWHTDARPNRVPMIVAANDLVTPNLHLSKFGKPAEILPTFAVDGRAVFTFNRIEVHGDSALVEFAYDAEGVAGSAELAKRAGVWEVVKAQVHER